MKLNINYNKTHITSKTAMFIFLIFFFEGKQDEALNILLKAYSFIP